MKIWSNVICDLKENYTATLSAPRQQISNKHTQAACLSLSAESVTKVGVTRAAVLAFRGLYCSLTTRSSAKRLPSPHPPPFKQKLVCI